MKHLSLCKWTEKTKYNTNTHLQLFCPNFPTIRKIGNSILFTIILLGSTQVCWGQAEGDFRSKLSGSFGLKTNWQTFDAKTSLWVQAQSAPGSGSNTTIRTGHVMTIRNGASCNNLTIDSGGELLFGGGYSLGIMSDLVINGKVTIFPGANINVNIAGNGKTTLGAPECLLIQSNSEDYTGSIISRYFLGSGTIKLERYMSNSDNWHLFSSPVLQSYQDFIFGNPEIPDVFTDPAIDNTYIGVGMRDYNTTSDIWNSYFNYRTNTPTGNVGNCKGFSIRTFNDASGTGFIYATGVPNSSLSIPLVTTGNKWNCIGNPFTSGLSVSSFLNLNSSLLDPSFVCTYLWDSTNGAYIAYNKSTGTNIQLGQGFFVKASSTGGSISFNFEMQVSDMNIPFKEAEIGCPLIKILINNQTLKSDTKIKFIPNTTKGLDLGYDAGMLKANKDFALYSRLLEDNGVDFMLQCLPDQDYDQYVIPIGLDCKVAGDITFTAETVNLPSGCQALLEDRLTKRFTRLDLKDAKYTAAVSADTKGTGRFYLHTSDVISGTQPVENQLFKVYKTGKIVYINGEVSENAKFFIYSVNGTQLANFNASSLVQNQFDASGLPAGVYILNINDKNQNKSVKFVIEN